MGILFVFQLLNRFWDRGPVRFRETWHGERETFFFVKPLNRRVRLRRIKSINGSVTFYHIYRSTFSENIFFLILWPFTFFLSVESPYAPQAVNDFCYGIRY